MAISIKFEPDVVQQLEQQLIKAHKLNNFDLYKKALCLLMINEDRSFLLIAKRLNITIKTVYNWLKIFMVKRFNWLCMHHWQGTGRRSKLTVAQLQELYNIIVAGPEAAGFDCGIWNTAMIVLVIEKKLVITPDIFQAC